jgi:hypothetical protein
LGPIAKNQRQFAQNPNEFRFADRQFAHRYFRENPSMLNLGMPNDSVYMNFYNSENTNNLGSFENVRNSIEQQNILLASNINSSISPANNIENNRKTVNDIYLRSWANEIFSFSSSDSATLFNIAMQKPLMAGDAVYSARIMLGIEPGASENKTTNKISEQLNVKTKIYSAKIYPNPTGEEATLDYAVSENESGSLEIYSVLGEEITSFKLKPQERLTFITSGIQSGVYFYKVIINKENISSGKLIIIK